MIAVPLVPKGKKGIVSVPGSKSLSNRALLIAALAQGESALENLIVSEDSTVMITALRKLGIKIRQQGSVVKVKGNSGYFSSAQKPLNILNAGTAMRFLTAALAVTGTPATLTGIARMRERPIGDLVSTLKAQGARMNCLDKEGYPPITVAANSFLRGGKAEISGKVSSQFISALLLAAPYARSPLHLKITDETVSRPYLDLTISIMADFGITVQRKGYQEFTVPQGIYQGRAYRVEPDASAAVYFFAIAALNQAEITVSDIKRESAQGDIAFLDILEKMGCTVKNNRQGVTVIGPNILKPVGKINLNNLPDAALTVAVLAAAAKGESVLEGLQTLRHKECDRLSALTTELNKIGIKTICEGDNLIVKGDPAQIRGQTIATYDDHRLAMSFAILGTRFPNFFILNPKCVGKTYPHFWDDLKTLIND